MMKWIDFTDIGIELADNYVNVDPRRINFVTLRAYVLSLPDFDDDPERCGEKILEAIQTAWIEELD